MNVLLTGGSGVTEPEAGSSRTSSRRASSSSMESGSDVGASTSAASGAIEQELTFLAHKVLLPPNRPLLRYEQHATLKSIATHLIKRGKDSLGPLKGRHVRTSRREPFKLYA